MKIVAFDQKDSGFFKKKWDSLSLEIRPFGCNLDDDKDKGLLECQDAQFVLIHQNYCQEDCKSVVKQKNLVVMFVSGDGCKEHDDPTNPRVHYSKRVVPTGSDMSYLAPRFGKLCKNLETAGNDEKKIQAAWAEWERPVMEQVIEILSPMALGLTYPNVVSEVKRKLDALIREDDKKRGQLVKDELEQLKDISGTATLKEQIQDGVFSGNDFLLKWFKNYPNCLQDMSRRLL